MDNKFRFNTNSIYFSLFVNTFVFFSNFKLTIHLQYFWNISFVVNGKEICMLIRTIFLSTPDLTIHILVNYANINLLQALRMEFKHHSKVLFCHIWRKRSNLNEIRSHLVKIFGCRPGQKVVHDKLWQHANDNLCVLYCHLHLTLYQNQYLKW